MKAFPDWVNEQEVEYTIVIKLNDDIIYTETRSTGDSACEAIGRAENYVASRLNQEYNAEEVIEAEDLEDQKNLITRRIFETQS